MKFTETLNAARLRAGAMLRERRERAAERKAEKQRRDPPGVTVFEWQVRSAHILSWLAAGTAGYFLWSYCVGVAGDQAAALHITHAGTWVGDLLFYFPLLFGFVLLSIGIPYLAKSIIPIFVALSWREHFFQKMWTLFLVIGASFAIICGSFSVMGGALIEHGRGAAVATEQVQRQNAGLTATVAAIQRDIDDIAVPSSERPTYQMQACRVGATAWAGRVATARQNADPQLIQLDGALAYARQCDTLREQRRTAMAAEATATTVASVVATPAEQENGWLISAMAWVRSAWALILSILNDIVCLLMGWIAFTLERKRSVQLGLVEGIALHPYMLDDKRAEAAIRTPRQQAHDVADAMMEGGADPRFAGDMARSAASFRPMQSDLKNADTDETIIDKDGHLARRVREHTRKVKGKDGKPVQMMVPGAPPEPDEVGVPPERDGRDAELRAAAMHQPVEEWSAGASDRPETAGDDEGGPRAEDAIPERNVQISDEQRGASNANGLTEADAQIHPEPPEPELSADDFAGLADLVEPAGLASDHASSDEIVHELPLNEREPLPADADAQGDKHQRLADDAAAEQGHERVEPEEGAADVSVSAEPVDGTVDHHDTTDEPAREPETDPARLIAAE